MSSTLFSAVPAFTGSDYKNWLLAMESYLKATGLWFAISTSCPTQVATTDTATGNEKEVTDWKENDMKARGSIQLQLLPLVHAFLQSKDSAAAIW
jgi:hypothetical protein